MQIDFKEIEEIKNIIDIRSLLDYNQKNIPGSINVPKPLLMGNPEKHLNKQDTYFLLCDKGKVSLICAKILNALGYKCYSIIGGIERLERNF